MIVRVIGASPGAIRQMRAIAPAGVDIVDEAIAEPDWVVTATHDQRVEAIQSSGLPPHRVLENPAHAADFDQRHTEALRTALVKMGGIGPWRSVGSPLGERIAAMVVRRMMKRVAGVATPGDALPIGVGIAGVRTRIPAGLRLDQLLKDRALERARRLASHAVRLD
jgi:hypothetical protein